MKRTIIGIVLFSCFNFTTAKNVKYENDIICLAETIYRESRGEPYKGKLAVGQVVINRVKHSLYPSNICEVVFQKYQFSWTIGFRRFKATEEFKVLALRILLGSHELKTFTATHFHSNYVQPYWGKRLKKVAIIGNHIFYKL
jgi:spore germination cell wall hydrolase CwlJ-like protein